MDKYSIKLETIFEGKEVDTVPDEIKSYLNEEDKKQQFILLKKYNDSLIYENKLKFKWVGDGSKIYTVHFAFNKDFKDEIIYSTDNEFLKDGARLIPGERYYWRVTGNNLNSKSPVDSFIYSDKILRIITVDGSHNVRDLGGWKTTDGKIIRFGKLFRGGRLNYITKEGINVLKNELKVNTEIDLRSEFDDGGQRKCAFDDNAKYLKMNLGQYSYIIPQFTRHHYWKDTPSKIKAIFDCLSDESNYPIIFHCNGGADRTGTLAFLINGMLGVPYEELVKDFELTSFTMSGKRWRGDISDSFEQISDVMQDDDINYVAFDEMYHLLLDNYGSNIKDAIINYLINVCNVKMDQIIKIKNIMLKI